MRDKQTAVTLVSEVGFDHFSADGEAPRIFRSTGRSLGPAGQGRGREAASCTDARNVRAERESYVAGEQPRTARSTRSDAAGEGRRSRLESTGTPG